MEWIKIVFTLIYSIQLDFHMREKLQFIIKPEDCNTWIYDIHTSKIIGAL